MWEMWAALAAALSLAFGLARHDPKQFAPFSAGVLAVLWPLIGGMFGWDLAVLLAQIGVKPVLEPAAFVKAKAAIRELALPDGAAIAAFFGAVGLQVIRLFVKPPA